MTKKSTKFGGFWLVPKEPKGISPQARLLLGILCTYANGENKAWPRQELMANEIGCGVRSIRRYIDELVKIGVLEVENRGNKKNNIYHLVIGQFGLSNSEWADKSDRSRADKYDRSINKDVLKEEIDKKSNNLSPVGDEEFSFKNKLDLMFKNNSDRRMPIIAYYWTIKRFNFENEKQYEEALLRELRPAAKITGYSNDRIKKVCQFLNSTAEFKWTIESIGKYIDEDLDNLLTRQSKVVII